MNIYSGLYLILTFLCEEMLNDRYEQSSLKS